MLFFLDPPVILSLTLEQDGPSWGGKNCGVRLNNFPGVWLSRGLEKEEEEEEEAKNLGKGTEREAKGPILK